MGSKQEFLILEGTKQLATIKATNAFKAMHEFRVLFRNAWILSDPKKLSVVLVSKKEIK